MNDDTMLDCWRGFEAEVLAPSAGPIQHAEMRLAFFSGGWALLGLLDPASSPARLHARCRELYEELAEHVKDEGRRAAERAPKD